MTQKELNLFSELDEICNNLGISYTIKSSFGIGVYFTADITEKMSLQFGGVDRGIVGSFGEALEILKKATRAKL